MRPRHFLLPNHAFHHAQLPDAMSRKLVWKMICVNSSEVGSGCGEQGCTSPWRSPTTLLLHLWESPPCIPIIQTISFWSFCQVLPSWSGWDWVIFEPFNCKWRLDCSSDWTCEVYFLPVACYFIYWIVLLYTFNMGHRDCSFYCQLSLELCFLTRSD